jgi:hypothetical protein
MKLLGIVTRMQNRKLSKATNALAVRHVSILPEM